MKTRYKITAIAFSVLLGILFMPIIVSNLYCDYISDSCTSRITGVGPGGIYLPAEWGTMDNCHRYNPDTENMDPCRIDIAQISWPFPPRIHEYEHDRKCNEICPDSQEIIVDEYSKDEFNFSKLIRNEENQYCASTNEEQSDHCYSLEDIVFGDARKSWTVYPGGSGWQIPRTSTLEPIYKEVNIGMRSLNFTAMLDDKIFVNKCESNGGVWNYVYHDCEGLWNVCSDMGGINIQEDITPPCTDTGILDDDLLTIKVCRGAGIIRVSCVFENEN